jgi:hypothetical protein
MVRGFLQKRGGVLREGIIHREESYFGSFVSSKTDGAVCNIQNSFIGVTKLSSQKNGKG